MSTQIAIINKPIGKTPREMVDLFKEQHREYKDSVVSYAGRLDPMAHGLLLLLLGEENKKRENYLYLDKTYEVEVLFGFETDTYDVLGKVVKADVVPLVKQDIERELQPFVGKRKQEYPAYSSKAVFGKPLFWWARNEKLHEIEIPTREVEIFSIAVLSERGLVGKTLLQDIEERIALVAGDFRQEAILLQWRDVIDTQKIYTLVKLEVNCSSGTYMRSLAHELGKRLRCGAIAYDIYRTKVGVYTNTDVLNT